MNQFANPVAQNNNPLPVPTNELMKWCGLNHLQKTHLENVKLAYVFHDVAALVKLDDQVFLVGKNKHGSLGTGSAVEYNDKLPRKVDALCGKRICNFAFGAQKTKTKDKVKTETLSIFALTESGEVYGWGNNENGNLGIRTCTKIPVVPSRVALNPNVKIIQLACGAGHSVALSSEGLVWAWGRNFYGQVGNGNLQDHPFPVPIKIGHDKPVTVKMVACGSRHSAVLTHDGKVYTWGHNTKGQLGVGTDEDIVNCPRRVEFFSGTVITKITCGKHFMLAMSADKTIYAWGSNRYGQLGHGEIKKSTSPIRVKTLENEFVLDIAALPTNSVCAYQSETFKVFMWGKLPEITGKIVDVPWESLMTSISDIFSSYVMPPVTYKPLMAPVYDLTDLDIDEQVANIFGNFHSVDPQPPIEKVPPEFMKWSALKYIDPHYLYDVTKAFVCGSGFEQTAIYVNAKDEVYMIGKNVHGSFGTGNAIVFEQDLPEICPNLCNLQIKSFYFGLDVEGGCMCIFALTGSGQVYSWGYNEVGELGVGTTKIEPGVPTKIGGALEGVKITQLACGSDHTLAISDQGVVYSWGFNNSGQLGLSSSANCEPLPKKVTFKNRPQTKIFCISAGMYHSVAVTSDGHVFTWGINDRGQLGIPKDKKQIAYRGFPGPVGCNLPTIRKVVCGPHCTFAISTSGKLYFWGLEGTIDNVCAPTAVCVELGCILDVGTAHWSSIYACKTAPDRTKNTESKIFMWGKVRGRKKVVQVPIEVPQANSIQDVFANYSLPPCTLETLVVDNYNRHSTT